MWSKLCCIRLKPPMAYYDMNMWHIIVKYKSFRHASESNTYISVLCNILTPVNLALLSAITARVIHTGHQRALSRRTSTALMTSQKHVIQQLTQLLFSGRYLCIITDSWRSCISCQRYFSSRRRTKKKIMIMFQEIPNMDKSIAITVTE